MKSLTCCKCGRTLTGEDKKFRAFAKAQGWTPFQIGSDQYWRCGFCGPHEDARDENRGNR